MTMVMYRKFTKTVSGNALKPTDHHPRIATNMMTKGQMILMDRYFTSSRNTRRQDNPIGMLKYQCVIQSKINLELMPDGEAFRLRTSGRFRKC